MMNRKMGLVIAGFGVLSGVFAMVSCGNKSPVPVSPSGSVAMSVSLPPSSGAKTALLGAASNEVYYNITGPAMSPVTGVYGPVTTSGSTGTIAFSLAVPQGSARLMAFQINDASTHQPLALGAVQTDVSSQPSSQIVVEMGSLVRNCYNLNTSSFIDGSYFNIGNEILSDAATVTSTTNDDLEFFPTQGIFQMNALNADSMVYMGNGNLVNFAMAPANGSVTASGAAKQAAGAAVTQLQAGDIFCVYIPNPNAHIWIQITNVGSTTVGPSFVFRGNTTLPYYAYQQTPGDLAGPCATPIPTPNYTYTYSTQWGSSGTTPGLFTAPVGVGVDTSGNLYVMDGGNNRVQKFTTSGVFETTWGSSGNTNGLFSGGAGLAVDSSGNVYVADEGNYRIQKFTSAGVFVSILGGQGAGNGLFAAPVGVAVDSSGNVYVTDQSSDDLVEKFNSSGTFVTQWGGNGTGGNGKFVQPAGIAVDSSGNVYVGDPSSNLIQKFTSTGTFITQWGGTGAANGQFSSLEGVAVDSAGNVYAADYSNSRLQKFTSNGVFLTQIGTPGTGNGQFTNPNYLTVDSSGNVYVVDNNDSRVEVFAP